MQYFVTGGAGFIGSNMVDRLLAQGHTVTVYDNFSTGQRAFLAQAEHNPNLRIITGDLLDTATLTDAMQGAQMVYHFAANADVRFGTQHPRKDLEQNTIATFNVLEAMRANAVTRIAFSSTGSLYGEPDIFPTPENAPFPKQTSLYGASKVACEGLISAYCEGFGFQAWVFRFVSILGERYTHGHIFDFLRKLKHDSSRLDILGDGKQRKSYLYIHDCIDAILLATEKANEPFNLFNLGTPDYVEVNDSASWICKKLGVTPQLSHSGGVRGWVGDSPFIFLDTNKITALGWSPKISIQQAVERTVEWLLQNPYVWERA